MSTLQLYDKAAGNFIGGEAAGDFPMDFLSDTIKCSLHTATYTPSRSANEVKADATNELTTAFGYTAGGATLGTKTVVVAAAVATFDCADISWTAAGGSLVFRYAVFWDDTITTPADPLIGYIDCGAQTITDGNTFTIATGASGLFTGTVT